jgi:ATP-dependent DNA ligase
MEALLQIKPMLLTSLSKKELPNINPQQHFAFQKFDGFRAVWDKGRFYGRHLENWEYNFPEIMNALQPYQNCIFDGELINSKGVSKSHIIYQRLKSSIFHIKLMSGLYDSTIPATLPARFMVFDILEKDGKDLRNLPFEQRQFILQETIKENEWLQIVKPITKPFVEAFNEITEANGEGIVLKAKGSPYIETIGDKRSGYWLKCKNTIEKIIKFDGYEINPVGITLTDSVDDLRCACNGHKHTEVKEMIDRSGYAFVEVIGKEETDSGKIKEIVYSRLIK